MDRIQGEIMKVADQNLFTVEYFLAQPKDDSDSADMVLMDVEQREDATLGAVHDHDDVPNDSGDEEWIGID